MKDEGVQCDRGICGLWWHLDCGNVSRAEYNVMKKGKKSLMWFCEKCVDEAEVTMKSDQGNIGSCKDLMDKMDLLSSKIDSLASLNTRVETLERQIRSSETSIDKVIDMKLDEKLKEFEDKEKRKCNLVLFGIEESENTESAGRREDGVSSVRDICNKLRFDVSKLREVKKLNHSHLCIMGDFNHKEIKWNQYCVEGSGNSQAAKFFDVTQEIYLFQHA